MKLDPTTRETRVPTALLPAVMAVHVLRHRAHRLGAARGRKDAGALSIELALLVVALVLFAGLIVAAITALVGRKVDSLNGQ